MALQKEYGARPQHPHGAFKYLQDPGFYIAQADRYADLLGLCASRPLAVLDIGCGPGYFGAVCKHFGHSVLCLDYQPLKIYDELVKLFSLTRVSYEVRAFKPLPEIGKFSVITALHVCFNRHRQESPWGAPEWRYFVDDCRRISLPGAKMLCVLNKEKNGFLTPELEELFLQNLNGEQFCPGGILLEFS